MQPTPDDWDSTSLLTGALRDPRPQPRSHWPHLVAGFAALAVAALLVAATIRFIWPEPTGPTQADGEQRLHAIALPEGWQRSKIAYRGVFYKPETTWSEEILADSGDIEDVAATLDRAIRAAGWTQSTCYAGGESETTCAWSDGIFTLNSSTRGFGPLLKPPCPNDMSACTTVWLTMSHRG